MADFGEMSILYEEIKKIVLVAVQSIINQTYFEIVKIFFDSLPKSLKQTKVMDCDFGIQH